MDDLAKKFLNVAEEIESHYADMAAMPWDKNSEIRYLMGQLDKIRVAMNNTHANNKNADEELLMENNPNE